MAQPTYSATDSSAPQRAPVDSDAPYTFDTQGLPTQMAWPNDLVGAFAHRRRVTALPQLSPDKDPTIDIVIASQERYIQNMIQAVFSMGGIQDNATFRGLNLFILGDPKQASGYDVEAACRVLFSAVINRCLVGYCGSRTSDRLSNQGNKFEAVDKNGTCQERIDNVVKSLREWKSVCKEILTSDSKIDALANAPASVWQDKMDQKTNNQAKKESTQNDRKAAANAIPDAAAASQVAGGDLPPVVPAIRKNRPKSQKNARGAQQAAAAAASQDQTDLASLPSAPPSYSGSDGGGYAQPFSETDPLGFPTYAPAMRHPLFTNRPSFGFSHASFGLTRPDASLPGHQRSRPFVPGNPAQFQPAPLSCAPPAGEFPQGRFQGFDPADQQTNGFLGGNSGLTPNMGNLGITQAPVQNYHLAAGANAPQFHFHDLAMSPLHSDHPMFSPQGQFRGDSSVTADGATFTNPMMPTYRGPEEVVPAGDSDDLSEVPRVHMPPNPAAKHARTATMDAQAQRVPTRVKHGQVEDETAEDLDKDEEWSGSGSQSEV